MNRNLPPHPFTQINTKVPLQGAELEDFLQKEKVAKEQETARKAAQARKQRILEADEDDSESDSDSDSYSHINLIRGSALGSCKVTE